MGWTEGIYRVRAAVIRCRVAGVAGLSPEQHRRAAQGGFRDYCVASDSSMASTTYGVSVPARTGTGMDCSHT